MSKLSGRFFHSGMAVIGLCLLSVLTVGIYTEEPPPTWLFYPVPPALLAVFIALVLEGIEMKRRLG